MKAGLAKTVKQATQNNAAARRTCPRCGAGNVYRVHLPFYLRPLRSVGINIRAYHCPACARRLIIRHYG